MNCNRDHHSIALGVTDNDALNHIAFLMPDLESVMRGGGRMKDAGHAIEWGPGRHGPGNNAFNYFIDPFGVVIEYTAEVEQIDDSYRPRGPADWKWPPGRVDQWGISRAAERAPQGSAAARVRSLLMPTATARRHPMKFTTYLRNGAPRLGVVDGEALDRPERRPAGSAGRPARRAEAGVDLQAAGARRAGVDRRRASRWPR